MNQNLINISKIGLLLYWASVITSLVFFNETTIGHNYALIGGVVFITHIGETFIFSSTLKKYSDHVNRDKLLILLFGILVPTELKLKKNRK